MRRAEPDRRGGGARGGDAAEGDDAHVRVEAERLRKTMIASGFPENVAADAANKLRNEVMAMARNKAEKQAESDSDSPADA